MRFVGPLPWIVFSAIVGGLMYNLVCEGQLSAMPAICLCVIIVVVCFYMTTKVNRLVFKFRATKFPDTFVMDDE